MKKVKYSILFIVIIELLGFIIGLLIKPNIGIYNSLTLPPLSPKGSVFPIIWTLLYALMGISIGLIYSSSYNHLKLPKLLFWTQLVMNLVWPILFFAFKLYLISFVWLCGLWLIVIWMVISFYRINKACSLLQIPYILWITFAGYLNLMVSILN